MLKKIFILIIIVGFGSIVFGYFSYQNYQKFLNTNVFNQSTTIDLKKGTSYRKFVNEINLNNGNGKPWQWRLLAKLKPELTKLKAGEFEFEDALTPQQILKQIVSNQVKTYKFTIVEGMNWRELRVKLNATNSLVSVLKDLTDEKLLEKLNVSRPSPEGLFLPETYQYQKGDSDYDILLRAHKSLEREIAKSWGEKKENLPYDSPYDLLTMASIVEKESAQASERDEISGVFVRRLQKNMKLQTDPTVIYGIGAAYDGDIKTKDLRTDTPYNTYTRFGLPPTPIAMASKEAIIASANPKAGTSLYFVANNRGGHFFSDTYEQHKKAVKDYLKGKKL